MATFRPPTDPFVMFSDRTQTGIFAYLGGWPRGRNVFKLKTGIFTESDPADNDTVEKIYHGGHIHTLTAQEETDLINAGYGDYIEA